MSAELRRKDDRLQRHTIPYVSLRRKIGCNRNDTKGQTEDDELEQHCPAAGIVRKWKKTRKIQQLLLRFESLYMCLCGISGGTHSSRGILGTEGVYCEQRSVVPYGPASLNSRGALVGHPYELKDITP